MNLLALEANYDAAILARCERDEVHNALCVVFVLVADQAGPDVGKVKAQPLLDFAEGDTDIDAWDDEVFNSLPGWIQERIKKSTQYQKLHVPTDPVDVDTSGGQKPEAVAGAQEKKEENPICETILVLREFRLGKCLPPPGHQRLIEAALLVEGGGEVFAEPAGLVLAVDLDGLGGDLPNDQHLVVVLLEGFAVLLPQVNDAGGEPDTVGMTEDEA